MNRKVFEIMPNVLKRIKFLLVASLIGSITVSAQQVATSPATSGSRPRIGLVLGGGGALAFSDIGVLRWFEEHHIPVDAIAGTSMGSLVGAFYAAGKNVDEIERLTADSSITQVFRLDPDFHSLSYRRREDRRWVPNAITVGLRHGVSLRSGVLVDSGLTSFLTANLLAYDSEADFNDLPIPFRCVATDLSDGSEAIFRKGNLSDAVRASVSIPGVYSPAERDGHVYVDGALVENLPVATMRAELKPDVVLAVSLPLVPLQKGDSVSIFSVLGRSFSVASWVNELRSRKLADLVLEPDTKGFSAASYTSGHELAGMGYAAAEKQKNALLRYRVSDAEWAASRAKRRSLIRPQPGLLQAGKVIAPNESVKEGVQRALTPVLNKAIDTKKIEEALDDVRSDGRYNAAYGLRVQPPAATQAEPIAAIDVTVQDKVTGPPYLVLGANLEAQSSVPTRASLDATFLYQDLGGYHSELQARVGAGYRTLASVVYYRRLSAQPYFIAPHFDFLRAPAYIYAGQTRVAQRLMQSTGGGVDVGYTFKRSSELRFGWSERLQQWTTDIGTDGQPNFSGTAQWAGVSYRIDDQDRPLIAHTGLRGQASAGYFYNAVRSSNAPRFDVSGSYSITAKHGNLFSFGMEAGTYFNRSVATPFRYTLGGPFRLSASANEEFRGTDYALFRPAYLHRLATLPSPLGQSIYVLAAYEAGQMRAPDLRTVTRQDGFLGLAAETPLGVITFGPSLGDGGHRKLVFTLGRFF